MLLFEAQKYLEIVRKRGEANAELHKVYRLIRRKELYLMAYANLYANTGALTPGVDPEDTIDGMSVKRIETMREQLSTGSYRWKPARRTYRWKRDGKRKRPIGMPGWNDKLLEEVIRIVLEAYYEPQFRESSHGFRPRRGCHTALSAIYKNWTGTKWFIEGDIRACFDSLNHKKIGRIIGRKIKDRAFLELLKGMLKAGYVEDWTYHQTYSGTPQGGVLSPLIMNIVLNELDEYIEDVLIPKHTRGTQRKQNAEYMRITTRMQKLKRKRNRERHDRYNQLKKYRRQIPSLEPQDPEYSRLRYVRYADDFLLGFTGTKAEAERIKEEIGEFLKTLGLELADEKTMITHASTGKARFLNYHISMIWDDSKVAKRNTDNAKMRSLNGHVSLTIPRDVIRTWKRRVTRKGRYWHRAELIHLSDYDIISTYETELQGLINYYTMAHDIDKLRRLRHFWFMSLLKTLAAKHHSTVYRTYRKYKRYMPDGRKVLAVEIPRGEEKPLRAIFGKKPIRQDRNIVINDTIERIYTMPNQLITRMLANVCELCGDTVGVSVHHIRKLKDLKKRYQGKRTVPKWVKKMIAIRRKTLVVCEHCHQAIHAGTYDGVALT